MVTIIAAHSWTLILLSVFIKNPIPRSENLILRKRSMIKLSDGFFKKLYYLMEAKAAS